MAWREVAAAPERRTTSGAGLGRPDGDRIAGTAERGVKRPDQRAMITPEKIDPDDAADRAARLKKAARAPQRPPVANAPKAKPTESGKPIWDTPHSS